MPEYTDEDIAARVQAGDRESFGLLVERYEAKMTRYARRFLFDVDEVQDVVQDVFIKAYVNLKSLDTKRRFSPWLYRIAHNEFVNTLKKKKREKVSFLNLDVFFPHLKSPDILETDIDRKDIQETINLHLGEIDPKYREPLILYYMEELDYKEIAEVLHVPVSTVGVRLGRAKNMLKKIVEQKSYGKFK
ncbi:MAG: RNA polymerase sigma factor [Candidatus Magasanikbacteria bacterium]|nr:RNA polymerase sigma factor [Candidatus Magasanikbacteria bacterium]